MHFFIHSILLIAFNFIGIIPIEASSLCLGNSTSHLIKEHCDSYGGSMIFRCCRSNDNETFIAIDLTELDLNEVPDFTQYANFNLSAVDLRENPALKPSKDSDFLTLIYLEDLLLPETFICPGEQKVWEIINKTSDPKGNRCMQQKNFCLNSTDKCDEKGSICTTNGPDNFLCLCKDGYHGYKCLRYGSFPAVAFFSSTIAVTVLTSALLYWTQRRNIKQ